MLIIVFILLVLVMLYIVVGSFFVRSGNTFDVYFGVPGSGKTTFAAWITKRALKKKIRILSNVPIKGTYKVVKQDIGHYQIENCKLILDEAGVDYNNRKFKSFTDEEVYFFKYHRHYNVDITIFSQGYNDFDLKLRTLATRYYLVQKSILPFFVKRKLIKKRIGIDKLTKQIIDEYDFALFGTRWIFCPNLWKMFDSYDYKELPPKGWEMWGFLDEETTLQPI